MYKLKQPLGSVPKKMLLLKFENLKVDEWNIDDDDENIQRLQQIRLSGFCYTRTWYTSLVKPLRNNCERNVFNNIFGLQPANAIKTKFLTNSFLGILPAFWEQLT